MPPRSTKATNGKDDAANADAVADANAKGKGQGKGQKASAPPSSRRSARIAGSAAPEMGGEAKATNGSKKVGLEHFFWQDTVSDVLVSGWVDLLRLLLCSGWSIPFFPCDGFFAILVLTLPSYNAGDSMRVSKRPLSMSYSTLRLCSSDIVLRHTTGRAPLHLPPSNHWSCRRL